MKNETPISQKIICSIKRKSHKAGMNEASAASLHITPYTRALLYLSKEHDVRNDLKEQISKGLIRRKSGR